MTAWLTTDDVAQQLNYVPATIRNWCARGIFPGAKKWPDSAPRSEWRIPATDVEALKRERATTTPVPHDRLDQLMDAALAKSA